MHALILTALAFEPTPDTVVGTLPTTAVSTRQVEVPLSEGTRYHFTRLTAEIAPHASRHVEVGLKLRGTWTAYAVPDEQRSWSGLTLPGAELWLTGRPNDELVLSTFVGYGFWLGRPTGAYHVLPYETASIGTSDLPWVGTHVAWRHDALELQETLALQPGFFGPGTAASLTNVVLVRDRVQLMGSFIATPFELHSGVTARAQPTPWLDLGLGVNVPLRSLPEDDNLPLDLVLDLRVERPKDEELAPRQVVPFVREAVQFD